MDREDRIRYAEQLRSNKLLPEVIEECKASVIDAWKSCTDPDERDGKWYLHKAVEAFEETLYATLADLKPDESQ